MNYIEVSHKLIQKEELNMEEASNRRNLSESSSSGSFIHKVETHDTPIIRRRNRSSTRESQTHPENIRKVRSSSLQPGRRSSSEFCDQLAKRLSGEFGQNTTQNIQVRRRDSFLDISIPLDDTKSCESMESLLFFSQTISDTANSFQNTLNKTAEKFSKTLDETAATLKKAVSEKNPTEATTQELTKTLHKTAEMLSKTSEVLSKTAKTPAGNNCKSVKPMKDEKLIPKATVDVPDIPLLTQHEPHTPHSHSQALRLDTITSQSEVDPSDSDTEDIMQYVPVNQPLQKLKKSQNSGSSFSPIDPNIAEISQTPDETRPNSESSDLSFITPFGKTTNTKSAKDIFNKIKQPNHEMDFENPFSRHGPPTDKNRAESKSPERYTGSSVLQGRDTFQGPAPLNRTQSAAHVTSKPRSISVDTHGKTS
jgi:hypothetical protein